MHRAVVEQPLDQLPQLDGVFLQDARDLALLGIQVSHHAGGEQVRAFAQRRERGLQLVRDVLQEARFLRFQRDEPLAQPIELRSEAHHVVRALDRDRLGELPLAQPADALAHLRDGARDEVGEACDEDERGGDQRDHQPEDAVARLDRLRAQLLDAFVDHLISHLHQRLPALGECGELARQAPRQLRGGPGARDELVDRFLVALDRLDLGALAVGKLHRTELPHDGLEGAAVGAVGLEERQFSRHRVLAGGALERSDDPQERAARLRDAHRGMDGLLGERGEALEGEHVGEEREHQRCGDQREADQQQGQERPRVAEAYHLGRRILTAGNASLSD